MSREPKRDHVMREVLTNALSDADPENLSDIVEVVLRTLSQQKMIAYAPAGEISLLTTHGRALVAIIEDPGITLRALAVYLGISESNAQKSVKALLDMGLIAKTKVKTSVNYVFVQKTGFEHPDISRFFDGIAGEVRKLSAKVIDIQPFEVDEAPF